MTAYTSLRPNASISNTALKSWNKCPNCFTPGFHRVEQEVIKTGTLSMVSSIYTCRHCGYADERMETIAPNVPAHR